MNSNDFNFDLDKMEKALEGPFHVIPLLPHDITVEEFLKILNESRSANPENSNKDIV
jgi:hypothetical protein